MPARALPVPGGKMKKLSIALLALAMAVAITPTALAGTIPNIVYDNTNSVGVQAWTGGCPGCS
jgi:hypothetical protein